MKEIYPREKQYCKLAPIFDHFPLEQRRSHGNTFKSMSNVSLYILFSLLIVSVSSYGLINNDTSAEEKLTYKDLVTVMVS